MLKLVFREIFFGTKSGSGVFRYLKIMHNLDTDRKPKQFGAVKFMFNEIWSTGSKVIIKTEEQFAYFWKTAHLDP